MWDDIPLSLSASLFYDGQEEDKESGNSDCILLSHLEINEATHKRGGARERERERQRGESLMRSCMW